jgi:hypothetical protein
MKLHTLAAKPQLVEITLDDESTIQEFGEAITFMTWDRQPMSVFMRLAQATDGNAEGVISIVKDLILDDQGKSIITEDTMLPTHILMRAIAKVTETLGK